MKLHVRNVMWLLPLFLTACTEKPHPAPIQQYAPPVSMIPKPPVLHPALPESAMVLPLEGVETDADELLDDAAKPIAKRRKPVVKAANEAPDNAAPPPAPVQQAASPEKSESAIGDLSSDDPPDLRRETNDSIEETERGLRAIGRPLNGQEQKTANQIREFIRQARKALSSGDVDGAHTLAAKAKVLLGELSE